MATPNLLFIFTDEQRFDTLACYGNTRIHMPNLNRFASECTVIDRAYVTQPVCTPSRSSLMTGLYPHANGCTENNVPLPDDTPCLPEWITRGDYATAYHGKWHLGDEIFAQHGFDEWVSIEDLYADHYRPGRDRSERSSYHHWLVAHGMHPADDSVFMRGETARYPEHLSKPAFLAQEACRFLRANKDRPFIHFVNFLEPHMPFFGPRDGQYDPAAVELPPDFDAMVSESQPRKARLFQRAYYEQGHSGLPLQTEADWRRMVANYWGLNSLVDTYVGEILHTLDDCGLRENTIVVFTSDHGDMMGSHRLLAKCVMFEEAIRVPLLIRLPGQTKQKRITGPVSQIDLVPTLLELMGQPIPPDLQGESLCPIMTCKDAPHHDRNVFVEWNGPNSGIGGDILGKTSFADNAPAWATKLGTAEELTAAITDPVRTVLTPDGWKFNCSPLGEHELYNLNDDPYETENLATAPAWRPRMRELSLRIKHWQEQTGDAVDLPAL